MTVIQIISKGRVERFEPNYAQQLEIDKLHQTLKPGQATLEHLLHVVPALPSDFEPFGARRRDDEPDCCGCTFFHSLVGEMGTNWGVCTNVESPRVGLLTFDRMGCPKFVSDPRLDEVHEKELKILRRKK
jgi:hypothetical protein